MQPLPTLLGHSLSQKPGCATPALEMEMRPGLGRASVRIPLAK